MMSNFNDLADYEQSAFEAFKQLHEAQHPPPQRYIQANDDKFTMLALGILLVASIVVSASRTIVEFGGGIVGVSAFVMIEIGIIAYAYIRTKRSLSRAQQSHDTEKMLSVFINSGLYLALFVALGGNLHYVLDNTETTASFIMQAKAFLNTATPILLAIAAPLLAFISGDILGMLEVARSNKQREMDEVYKLEYSQWNDELLKTWRKSKSSFIQKARRSHSVHKRSVNNERSLNGNEHSQAFTEQNERSLNRANSYERTVNAMNVIEQYLNENPDGWNLSQHKLAQRVGVSVGSVNKFMQMKKESKDGTEG